MYSGACKAKSIESMRISKTELSYKTRTVVAEVKYFSTQKDVIRTKNCKLELPSDCSTIQMEKNIRRMCGIEESSTRRGFVGFAIEV